MKSALQFVVGLSWLACILASLSPVRAQETPNFNGTNLPVPPQQSQPWAAPPCDLPPAAVSAIEDLFNEGLADPRGCEYREIEIVTGSCSADGGYLTKTHGWVFPASDQSRFAVSWSGLVYPVVSVGAPADLHADVQAILQKDQAQLDEHRAHLAESERQRTDADKLQGKEHRTWNWPLRMNGSIASEQTNVSIENLFPLKAALLLRLGETEWANKVWKQWYNVALQVRWDDPYSELAQDWAWTLFDRAVCAHMRGDDHLSLFTAQLLAAVQPLIESKMVKPKGTSSSQLTFLAPLPTLIADEQRRLSEPAYTPILQLEHPPQGKEYVTGLIRDLELAAARQMSQPGGVNLADDPSTAALIKVGDAAVEPLLDCLENDTRLTRSVSFGRDFRPGRSLLGVQEAAYAALAGIFQTGFLDTSSTGDELREGRYRVAAAIRAYWQQNRGVALPDRWYRTLQDDKSTGRQWEEAADNIVQDVDVQVSHAGTGGIFWTRTPYRSPGSGPPAMQGESLRARTNPSVSDLLIQRIQTLSKPADEPSASDLRTVARLALALAKWDGKNQLTALRSVSDTLQGRLLQQPRNGADILQDPLAIYQARIQAGDAQATTDYAAWLSTLQPDENFFFLIPQLLEILWQHPQDPVIRAAAERLFKNPDSSWVQYIQSDAGYVSRLCQTPLIGLEAFRVQLLRGLSDPTVIGSVTLGTDGYVSATANVGRDIYVDDPLAPALGRLVHFRTCDLYAHELSQNHGFPKVRLYWPEEKRNQAVADTVRFLQRYGDLYQYQAADKPSFAYFHDAPIHFPRLDHPATPEDVAQNRAIFALEGERRVWQMPEFPMAASWTALKDAPCLNNYGNADGTTTTRTYYSTQGTVFQAEEKRVDGKWERFFGFAGPYHLAKVPAAEIEFPNQKLTALTHSFECELIAAGDPGNNGVFAPITLGVNQPALLALKIRNRSGLDQTLPGSYFSVPGSDKMLPPAITLTVEHTVKTNTDFGTIADSDWRLLPPTEGVKPSVWPADSRTVAATEEATLMSFDLRDFFDLTAPGMYRVQACFADFTGPQGKSNWVAFGVPPQSNGGNDGVQ